jgi:hypothetical protein
MESERETHRETQRDTERHRETQRDTENVLKTTSVLVTCSGV